MIASISFCPASAAVLPELGRSAFVRRAVLAYAESLPPSPSKGELETIKPEAVKPEPVKAYNPADWVRDGRMPDMKLAPYRYTELRYAKDGECLNPPAWPAFPGLNGIHNSRWREYLDKWKWPEPFPSPLEWVAMGQPEEPLPEHRRAVAVEPVAVEPVTVEAVEPVAVEPVTVKAVEPDTVPPQPASQDSPLQGGRVSVSVLEEI
jgi:hypothetical protein